jgi:hypothetical protein
MSVPVVGEAHRRVTQPLGDHQRILPRGDQVSGEGTPLSAKGLSNGRRQQVGVTPRTPPS